MCPICGANCKCRKRGPGGLCCSCHRHKPRAILEGFSILRGDRFESQLRLSLDRHKAKLEKKIDLAATDGR
jgi:hypothetical protein